jgi:hypothetical protein
VLWIAFDRVYPKMDAPIAAPPANDFSLPSKSTSN